VGEGSEQQSRCAEERSTRAAARPWTRFNPSPITLIAHTLAHSMFNLVRCSPYVFYENAEIVSWTRGLNSRLSSCSASGRTKADVIAHQNTINETPTQSKLVHSVFASLRQRCVCVPSSEHAHRSLLAVVAQSSSEMALVAMYVPVLVFAHIFAAFWLVRMLLLMYRPCSRRRAARGSGAGALTVHWCL